MACQLAKSLSFISSSQPMSWLLTARISTHFPEDRREELTGARKSDDLVTSLATDRDDDGERLPAYGIG